MLIGLDIGSSTTKMVRPSLKGEGFDLVRDPCSAVGGCAMDDRMMSRLVKDLVAAGVTAIGLTGTGAEKFSRLAREAESGLAVYLGPESDPIENELVLQADGVSRMLVGQGMDNQSFMVVSIGTGTSFTLVREGAVRHYQPGLALGGRYIERLAALVEVETADIESTAARGYDCDLLVKHVNPKAKFPFGDYVVASMGRLGDDDAPACAQNVVGGAVKTVATAVAGHLLSIMNHPDWQWDGTTVFIGTPVDRISVLRDWLAYFCLGMSRQSVFLGDGSFAGALGAYCLAARADGGCVLPMPKPGLLRRWGGKANRSAGLVGSVARRALRRR